MATITNYITFIDSDDWLFNEDALNKFNNFITDEDVLFVGGVFNYETNNDIYIPNYKLPIEAINDQNVACWFKVVKTDLAKKLKFSENTLMEDYIYHVRLCSIMKSYKCLGDLAYVYNRMNTNSVTRINNLKWRSSRFKLIGELMELYEELGYDGILKRLKDEMKAVGCDKL